MRALTSLVEERRLLVDETKRITNRLTNTLKQYHPQAVQWFEAKNTILFCDFVSRWPTLKQVEHARKGTLQAFFWEHHVRHPKAVEERLAGIKAATPLTEDVALITPHRLLAQALVDQLRAILQSIERFDAEISTVSRTLPDYALFDALPGGGPALAPRLLVALGFLAADELQRYSSIAPVTERSGNKSWVHWRWQCPKFLRQTFVEWAAQTINKSFWAGATDNSAPRDLRTRPPCAP